MIDTTQRDQLYREEAWQRTSCGVLSAESRIKQTEDTASIAARFSVQFTALPAGRPTLQTYLNAWSAATPSPKWVESDGSPWSLLSNRPPRWRQRCRRALSGNLIQTQMKPLQGEACCRGCENCSGAANSNLMLMPRFSSDNHSELCHRKVV